MFNIIAACISGGLTVVAALIGLDIRRNLKTGNGISAGKAIYALLEHVQTPIDQAHPPTPTIKIED